MDVKTKIYFRVDADSNIGLGHVYRALALSEMLCNDFDINFFSLSIAEGLKQKILEKGFKLVIAKSENDFFDLFENKSIIIIDKYKFPYELAKEWSKKAKIVYIDDIYDNHYFADLIINHSPLVSPFNYKALAYTQFAIGTNYLILRQEFLKDLSPNIKINEIKSCYICFGGSDPRNITLRATQLVREYFPDLQIEVVVGLANQNIEDLKLNFGLDDKIKIHFNIDEKEQIKLLQKTQLAIVPSSSTMLEVLTTNNIVVAGMYIENQKELFSNFKNQKAIISAESFAEMDVRKALDELMKINFPFERKNCLQSGSSSRILKLFKTLELEYSFSFKKAVEDDLELTFKWASDKKIRSFSYSKNEIVFEEHKTWFLSKINTPSCFYYIAQQYGKSIGSIRFDISNNQALISYLIDSELHGLGLGSILLKMGIKQFLDDRKGIAEIVGFVMKSNLASCKAFEKIAFESFDEGDSYKYIKKIS